MRSKQPSRPLTRRDLLVVGGASVLSIALPRVAHADACEVKSFLGTYEFAGGDSERRDLDQAIDSVVSSMNFLVRGIARSKLKKANPVIQTISIAQDATTMTVTLDDRVYRAPLDGSKVGVKSILGDDMSMAYLIAPMMLSQLFTGDEKGRTNQFSATEAGCTMLVRVFASRLPKDLNYALSYRRH